MMRHELLQVVEEPFGVTDGCYRRCCPLGRRPSWGTQWGPSPTRDGRDRAGAMPGSAQRSAAWQRIQRRAPLPDPVVLWGAASQRRPDRSPRGAGTRRLVRPRGRAPASCTTARPAHRRSRPWCIEARRSSAGPRRARDGYRYDRTACRSPPRRVSCRLRRRRHRDFARAGAGARGLSAPTPYSLTAPPWNLPYALPGENTRCTRREDWVFSLPVAVTASRRRNGHRPAVVVRGDLPWLTVGGPKWVRERSRYVVNMASG